MVNRESRTIVLALAVLTIAACESKGQGPNVPITGARGGSGAGSGSPGSISTGNGPGAAGAMLGGRAGPSVPRVPSTITRPDSRGASVPLQEGIVPPASLPLAVVPQFGPLEIPAEGEEEGPPDGLTLDEGITRLIRDNLALKAKALEIPQARADVLTAGLRANPLLYADSQLVPYGQYSNRRPGGPVQYDVNVTVPLDVTRKRKARTVVAVQAKRVLEAQYQNAVRLQIDNLYTAYSDVLAARETIRFASSARNALAILLDRTKRMQEGGSKTIADVSRIESIYEGAEVELMDVEETYRSTKRNLGVLLGLQGPSSEAIEIRGSIRDDFPPPPPIDELIRMTLQCRPDVVAYRIGIGRADAEIQLARANRLSDVYLLYQPYTFQNNAPFGKQSAHSWAVGMTVPLPLFDRNQGNIQKARVNAHQSRIELADVELAAVNEVRQAEREYAISRGAMTRIAEKQLPAAAKVRDDVYRLYVGGQEPAVAFLNAQREYNDAARRYRDMLVRHRRSMLRLNTSVGYRILP